MKIADVDLYLVEIPRGAAYPPVRSLVVRLASDEGIDGWGEAASDWQPAEIAGRKSTVLAALVGRAVFNVAELSGSDVFASAEIRSAVEMAQWDLLGRAVKQPLSHLWGGMYRQRIPLAVRLPSLAQSALAAFARELADCGYHAQILTATGKLEVDITNVEAVREALGTRAELRFDGANQFAINDARRLVTELAHENVAMLIDPLISRDREHLSRLAHQSDVPIAEGVGIRSPQDVFQIAREDGIRAVVIAPERLGGLSGVRNAAAVADAAGLTAALAGRPTLGLGVAARLQLAAAIPRLAIANECTAHDLKDDILAAPLVASDGMLAVPSEPGLGVLVDRAQLDRWQAR